MKLITLGALVFGGTLLVAVPVVLFTPVQSAPMQTAPMGAAPMQPNSEIPTFAQSVAQANDVYADDDAGAAQRNAVRRAVITKAQGLRAAPCNARAKSEYLAAVSAYAVAKMAAVRAGEEDQWRTALDDQFGQVTDQQVWDGFVTMRESREAMMAGASRGWFGGLGRAGQADEGANDATACERQQAGVELPPLKLEHPRARPQPRPVSSDRQNHETLFRLTREAANEALGKDPCTAEGKAQMISGLSYYYEMRDTRRQFWPQNAGPDRAIDGRVASLIRRGKLRRSELPGSVARAAPEVAATPGEAGATCRDGR
jgi:hypothetical protein